MVPGAFAFSLDVRAYDEAVLAELERRMHVIIAGIEARRGVRFDLGNRASAAVGKVNADIRAGLERAAEVVGVKTMPLGSPASHDAAAFAVAGVPMGMLFIRNENGSHNPDEAMELDDFLDASAILTEWLRREVGASG